MIMFVLALVAFLVAAVLNAVGRVWGNAAGWLGAALVTLTFIPGLH